MSRLTADIYVCYPAVEQTLMSVVIPAKIATALQA